MITAVRQRRVVQRASLLANTERLTADLQHQRLGDGVSDLVSRGDPEACLGQSGNIFIGTGERHRRVDGKRNAATGGQWSQQCHAVSTGRMGHDGASANRAGHGKAVDQSG